MAFDINGLTLLAPAAAGNRTFRYTTVDAQAAVDTYFDDAAAAPHLAAGDIIFISWDSDGTPIGEATIVTASDGVSAVTCGTFDVAGT